MGPTTKLRLAAWGGTLAILGLGFGYGVVDTALEKDSCQSRPSLVSIAYALCR